MNTNKQLDFKFLADLVYYDGPLVSLGITKDNTYVFTIWLDEEENYNLYAYVFITEDEFNLFINSEKNYYNTLKDSEEIVSFKYNKEAYEFEEMKHDYFLTNYAPEEDVLLTGSITYFNEKLNQFKSNH